MKKQLVVNFYGGPGCLNEEKILNLYQTKQIVWLPRYEQKFKERYLCQTIKNS